jgi:hypothetical protein
MVGTCSKLAHKSVFGAVLGLSILVKSETEILFHSTLLWSHVTRKTCRTSPSSNWQSCSPIVALQLWCYHLPPIQARLEDMEAQSMTFSHLIDTGDWNCSPSMADRSQKPGAAWLPRIDAMLALQSWRRHASPVSPRARSLAPPPSGLALSLLRSPSHHRELHRA